MLGYSIDDDREATQSSVDAMMAAYPHAERRHLIPADAGLVSTLAKRAIGGPADVEAVQ